mmetsp:Transcript_27563/g.64637  ORF Transcript_27563/g.64637 Transcript_27563/m.64637 type:complete len:247 (-) Transcript_27563:595-1335(-)
MILMLFLMCGSYKDSLLVALVGGGGVLVDIDPVFLGIDEFLVLRLGFFQNGSILLLLFALGVSTSIILLDLIILLLAFLGDGGLLTFLFLDDLKALLLGHLILVLELLVDLACLLQNGKDVLLGKFLNLLLDGLDGILLLAFLDARVEHFFVLSIGELFLDLAWRLALLCLVPLVAIVVVADFAHLVPSILYNLARSLEFGAQEGISAQHGDRCEWRRESGDKNDADADEGSATDGNGALLGDLGH